MTKTTRLALLRLVVLLSLAFRATEGNTVGLGPLRLQSALGQPLRASLKLVGGDTRGLADNCVRSRLSSPEGAELARPEIELRRTKGILTDIVLTTRLPVDEPAASLLVEITCTPTLHRDYQLILDLRDGLPRAMAGDADDGGTAANGAAAPSMPLPSAADTMSGMLDLSVAANARPTPVAPKKRRVRKVSAQSAALAAGAAEARETGAEPTAPPEQTRLASSARNILKLSQEDLNFGLKMPAVGLKLSDSLSAQDDLPSTINSDDVRAAKARYVAMLHDEDPVLLAQKQVSALKAQLVLQQSTMLANAQALAQAQAQASSGSFLSRTMPAFNKWLIGLAALLLASMGVAAILLRSAKRAGAQRTTPWWLAANDAADREAALLDAARASMAAKKQVKPAPREIALNQSLKQDEELQEYVNRFVGDAEDSAKASSKDSGKDSEAGDLLGQIGRNAAAKNAQSTDATADRPGRDLATDGLPNEMSRASLATFELVSDVMQEAEFWKMLNETPRAIDILENYCNSEASSSPVPWLYLADLYAANGDMERHAQLRERFRERFNGRISDDEAPAEGSRHSLEDYPHLMQQISNLWENGDVLPFLQSLLINDRDDPREGFDLLVYREILLLIDVARERLKAEA